MPQDITPTPTPVEVVTETYEERRAEALEDMGLELEDIRNEERFRLAMLQGINGTGGSSSGGANYKAYDFVIRKIGDGTPTLEKGSYGEVYDKLQNQEPVTGVYVENTEVGEYHDTRCHYVPFDEVYYYSSADFIAGHAVCIYNSSRKLLELTWEGNSISININNN